MPYAFAEEIFDHVPPFVNLFVNFERCSPPGAQNLPENAAPSKPIRHLSTQNGLSQTPSGACITI
jgi:hypothetical protein